ncbi:MAG: hypothetical protein ACI88A_002912 [Paraglaciecola sp.]|jgi:hypothetical protein
MMDICVRTILRCLALFLCCLKLVNAEAPVQQRQVLSAAELSGLFHHIQQPQLQEERGVYFHVLAQILDETGLKNSFEIIVMPMKRAKKGFVNHEYACYSPGFDTFDLETKTNLLENVLVSAPLNRAIVRVASAKHKSVINGFEDIGSDDLISMVRGTPMSPQMQEAAKRAGQFFFVNSELENISMLQNGRVNKLFLFYPDVLFAYKKLGITEHFPYAKQFAPLVIDDTVVCHKDYASAFALINEKINQYRRDGTLKRMLGDFYMIDSPYMDLAVE